MKISSKFGNFSYGSKSCFKLLLNLPHLFILSNVVFIGALFLLGFIFGSWNTAGGRAEFPKIDSSTRIILKPFHTDSVGYDLSGDPEIIKALLELKFCHYISGRSVGKNSINGTIEINNKVFRLAAARIDIGGYRAVLEIEPNGYWEGHKLAEVLLRKAESGAIK